MAFKLIKTDTFVHTCEIMQIDEDGKKHHGKLRVRFNKIARDEWNSLTKDEGAAEDDRLLYDVLVVGIETPMEGPDGELKGAEAVAAVRQDLSVTSQVVDQGFEALFGAAAKNARRSRSR